MAGSVSGRDIRVKTPRHGLEPSFSTFTLDAPSPLLLLLLPITLFINHDPEASRLHPLRQSLTRPRNWKVNFDPILPILSSSNCNIRFASSSPKFFPLKERNSSMDWKKFGRRILIIQNYLIQGYIYNFDIYKLIF